MSCSKRFVRASEARGTSLILRTKCTKSLAIVMVANMTPTMLTGSAIVPVGSMCTEFLDDA